MTLEDVADWFSRNVGDKLPKKAALKSQKSGDLRSVILSFLSYRFFSICTSQMKWNL